ncbi:MAG: lipocalin family protein [Oscillospiraceae bacterium]|nr:lipocalin family protein [Oscillospiraceae bacterium]
MKILAFICAFALAAAVLGGCARQSAVRPSDIIGTWGNYWEHPFHSELERQELYYTFGGDNGFSARFISGGTEAERFSGTYEISGSRLVITAQQSDGKLAEGTEIAYEFDIDKDGRLVLKGERQTTIFLKISE